MIGKILGCYFGYTLAAPVGLGFCGVVIGIWLGNKFDRGLNNNRFSTSSFFTFSHSSTQKVFFDSSFAVMGYIAKSDGIISENEIRIAQDFMRQLNLNGSAKSEAIASFKRGKSNSFDLDQELNNLKSVLGHNTVMLRLFVEIQSKAAAADGFSEKKIQILNNICSYLGFSSMFNNNYYQGGYYDRYDGFKVRQDSSIALQKAYDTLEVNESVTDSEIKKSYRRLLGKNHPDRLIAKGLPKEMLNLAHEKTIEINKAYDLIKQSRNLK